LSDLVIIDTAGRLAIDTMMMEEISMLKEQLQPSETLFVVDAMVGQDAVNTAQAFHEQLGFDGVVLTKLDGDARGGVALSMYNVIEKPIKFISTGEKPQDLDLFHPDRMANRILGMGDVISFVERAEQIYNEEQHRNLSQKIKNNQFNLEDLLEQIRKIKKMGNIKEMLSLLPGKHKKIEDMPLEENFFKNCETIIMSMTPKERTQSHIIDRKRKERIALGSGTSLQEVNQLLKQFDMISKLMKKSQKGGFNVLPNFSGMYKKFNQE